MPSFKSCSAALAALLMLSQVLVARAELPDFTELVEQASPAVVNISTRQKVARNQLVFGDGHGALRSVYVGGQASTKRRNSLRLSFDAQADLSLLLVEAFARRRLRAEKEREQVERETA